MLFWYLPNRLWLYVFLWIRAVYWDNKHHILIQAYKVDCPWVQPRDSREEKCGYLYCIWYCRIWVKIIYECYFDDNFFKGFPTGLGRSVDGYVLNRRRLTKTVKKTWFPHNLCGISYLFRTRISDGFSINFSRYRSFEKRSWKYQTRQQWPESCEFWAKSRCCISYGSKCKIDGSNGKAVKYRYFSKDVRCEYTK